MGDSLAQNLTPPQPTHPDPPTPLRVAKTLRRSGPHSAPNRHWRRRKFFSSIQWGGAVLPHV